MTKTKTSLFPKPMFCFLRFFSHAIVSHSAKPFILSGNKFFLPTSTILVYITYNRISRIRGIDPEVLSTFPTMVYPTVKNLRTGHNVALQCAVCLSEFKDLDKLRLLPKCSHVFHQDCIDAWLASHVTCPVCRAKLKPENAEFMEEIGEGGSENQVFDESSERRGEVSCEGNEGGFGGRVDGAVEEGNGTSRVEAFGVLARSHSTGHSLVEVEPGKSFERFTLRLPEEVRKQIHDGNNND